MRERISRMAAPLATLLAACAALLAVAVALLVGGVQRARLVELAERQLAAQLGARVEIGAVDGPLYPSAELRDVHVEWPEASLHVARISVRYALERALGGTRLHVTRLAIQGPSLELRGIPSLPASSGDGGGSAVRIDLAALEIRAGEIRWVDSPLGSLEARLDLTARDWALGGDVPWPAQADLRASATLEREGAGPLALTSAVELSGTELRVHRLRLDGAAGHLASHGHAALDASGVHTVVLDATAQRLDLAELLAMPGLRTDLAGSLGVRAERGRDPSWRNAQANVQARLAGSAAGDAIHAIDVQATLARDAVEIARADVRGPALELHAHGTLRDQAAFEIEGSVPELARLEIPSLQLPPLKGALALEGQVRGPREALEANVSVRGKKLAVAARSLGELEARLALKGQRLAIERARLVHGPERLEVEGALDLSAPSAPRAEDLRLAVEQLDLASLERVLPGGPALRGRLSGRASVTGTLREPRGEARLRVQAAQIDRFAADRLELELDIAQRWRGKLLAALPREQGSAELRVDLPPAPDTDLRESWKGWLSAPDGSLELDARRLDVALAQPFLPKAVNAANGRVDLQLRAAGGWPPQTLKGQARVDALTVAVGAPSRSFGPARGTLELGPRTRTTGSVDFRADLDFPDAWRGHAAGRVQLRRDLLATRVELTDLRLERRRSVVKLSGVLERGAFDPLRVEIDELDIASLPSIEGLEALGGRLDAQFVLHGTLRSPVLSGAAVWEEPRVGPAHADRATLEWATGDGKLTGDLRILEAGAVVATAQLRAPAPSDGAAYTEVLARQGAELKLDAHDLDVALLAPLLSGLARDARGRLTLHAEASGDPWKPRLSGQLALREGSLRIPALGQTFTPIEAELRASDDTIRIEKLWLGSADGGRAELTGHADVAGLTLRRLDARVQLDGLAVMRAGGTRVNVDGNLGLEGPIDGLRFSGDVALRESRFGVPQKDDPLAKEIRILRSSSDPLALTRDEPSVAALWVRRSAGTLRLRVPSNTWIRGAGAELELSGTVELRKQPLEEPRFFGALEVVRGEYRFANRKLVVEQGRASFTGTALLDPQLDVRVTTDVDEYHVTVLLRGPLSNPNLEPTSDPPLARNDVLALLLFGSRSRDAGAERALALDLALAELGTDLAANQLTEQISRFVPVDTFRLGVADDGNGATLELGRYLRKDVFVRYEQTVGTKTSDAIIVEWRLTPTFRVESSTSTTKGSGADLIWRKDY